MSQESIFSNGKTPDFGIGYHNVGTGVLRGSSPDVSNAVNTRYGARLGHLPPAMNGHFTLMPPDVQTQTNLLHLQYLSLMYGVDIKAITPEDANRLPGSRLLVPYINTADVKIVNGPETTTWGLPAEIVDRLKNKVLSHKDMQNYAIEGICPVDFKITDTNELIADSSRFLTDIRTNYQKVDMESNYPVGLMIRPDECDGGYGNATLQEIKGKIVFTPNGDIEGTIEFDDWESALKEARQHVIASSKSADTQVVISRLIDVEDSPWMTIIILDGKPFSLGWNGQIFNNGSRACVGTSTFNPSSAHSYKIKSEYEEESVNALTKYINTVATDTDTDLSKVRGVVNVDFIIPGPKEREYLLKTGRDPDTLYVAEFNPRWTNGSDAAAAAVWSTTRQHTPDEYIRVVNEGLLAIDKERVSPGDPEQRYQTTIDLNRRLREDGSGVILRMPGYDTLGVIYWGDTTYARAEFLKVI